MWPLLALLACDPEDPRIEGQEVGDCDNRADDDADGAFDCDDEGCEGAPACEGDTDTDSDTDSDSDADTDTDADADRWSGSATLDAAGVALLGERAGDGTGVSVDVGDFDGDGIADVATGAYDSPHEGGNGAVYVVHGPIASEVVLSSGADALAYHWAPDSAFGWSLSFLRDTDGDGADELLVGAPTGGSYDVFLLETFTGSLHVGYLDGWWNEEEPGDHAGWDVADAGDIDGDGVHDAMIGAPFSDFYATKGGVVYLLAGPPSVSEPLGWAHARIFGAENESFGAVVAALGDVDGDGHDDVAASEHRTHTVRVFLGTVSGVVMTADADATLDLSSAETDTTTTALAGGSDIDGDGTADVVVGISGPTATTHGRVAVLSGPRASGDVDLASADALISGDAGGDGLGAAVHTVDFDGDGFGDLVASATGASSQRGAVYVFYGAVSGALVASDADATFVGADAGGFAGTSLAAGDVTGDGLLDLLVGAPLGDGDGPDAGLVTIVAGL